MKEGDRVKKITGYSFSGDIVSAFKNKKGEQRYVVESTMKGSEGWLMIFNEKQLTINT